MNAEKTEKELFEDGYKVNSNAYHHMMNEK